MTVMITQSTGPATKRKELRDYECDYKMIADCVAGERVIKQKSTLYLPMPNAEDTSRENILRYDAYKKRAVFYNVTQRTLSGMVGEVFARAPVVEIPASLDVISEDADGSGLTLTQLAKRAVRYTLSSGRAGILADYPMTSEGVTRADVESGDIRPTLTVYGPMQIINWRVNKNAGKSFLELVVLHEKYDEGDTNGFGVMQKDQYRVLRLNNRVYTVEVYRDGGIYQEAHAPTDASGATFDYIPFTFSGSENNDSDIDHPPMYDLAALNIAHYHNSADYEESIYMFGQPTPVFSGLTEEWVNNVMNGQVRLGSRGGVMLPEGGDAKILSMEANTAAFQAMEHKERQMVAIGAKLVESRQIQRTATEANIENASETSVLSDVANNVSAAIKFALEVCAKFTGDDNAEIAYQLNTDYYIARMSAQEQAQLIAEWQQGAITFSEMRAGLRKSGVATLDDNDARNEIESESFIRGSVDNKTTNIDASTVLS